MKRVRTRQTEGERRNFANGYGAGLAEGYKLGSREAMRKATIRVVRKVRATLHATVDQRAPLVRLKLHELLDALEKRALTPGDPADD